MSAQVFVSMSVEQLTDIIREAVEATCEKAGVGGSNVPSLLDRNGIAGALGCSAPTVDRLRREGMPCIRIGESPRFDLGDCLAWLRGKRP